MKTHRLKKPVKITDTVTISEVTIPEEVTCEHLMGAKMAFDNFDDLIAVVANMTGQPRRVVGKFAIEDLITLGGIVGDLLGNSISPTIGMNA